MAAATATFLLGFVTALVSIGYFTLASLFGASPPVILGLEIALVGGLAVALVGAILLVVLRLRSTPEPVTPSRTP